MSERRKVFGIDLGTTYSAIAHMDEHNQPVVMRNQLDNNDTVMPSVVLIEEGGNIVVGEAAKSDAVLADEERVFEEIKRSMGDRNYAPREVDGHTCTPEFISSLILKKLAKYASDELGETVEDVVITVPAYFGESRREATKKAGEIAGLNVRAIVNEPTAAALCYDIDKEAEEQTVLVYDLGGGTFDVTIIDVRENAIEVIVTGGAHDLGGKRWDEAIIRFVAEQFQAEHGIDPLDDPQATQDLRNRCEEAKKTLTNRKSTNVRVDCGKRTMIELTREKFDELTQHLLDNSITLTRELMQQAKDDKGVDTIDKILLVGGSTRMPQVSEALREEFDMEPQLYDPDEAVAKGAALMGMKLLIDEQVEESVKRRAGENAKLDDLSETEQETVTAEVGATMGLPQAAVAGLASKQITMVCSHSIGVVVTDSITQQEEVAVLIPAQTSLPFRAEQRFGTNMADQRNADIRVMEGESKLPEDCDQLNPEGNILPLPPGLPAQAPIQITFEMDTEGIIHVWAEDLTGHEKIDFEIETEGVMSDEEVAAARAASEHLEVE